ncbi:MAG: alginate export family protein [Planctomycetota bacterium]
MKPLLPHRSRLLASLITTCLLPAMSSLGQEVEPEPAPSPEHPLVTFLKEGKVNLDMRFRYEYGSIDGLDDSNAFTMRTRLGYTTKVFSGFQGMIEFEDNRAADDEEYFGGDNGNPFGQTVIADPEDTQLNRLWVSYDFKNLSEDIPLTAKVGRQRIILDDARFVGNVGWRQLEQTYDAALLSYTPMEELTAKYAFIEDVRRIFGDDSTNAANTNFTSNSHLINVAYTGLDIGKLVGFAYLLDLDGSTVGLANSSQTYGVRLDGSTDLNDGFALGYIGSFAFQSDYGDNPNNYDAIYVLAEGKLKFKDSPGSFIGAGFELLGSDNGAFAFRTPLATGHKFNGFADAFLVTPNGGLRDYYITGGTTIPGINVKAMAAYHYFTGDNTNSELGQELDFVLIKKLNDNATVLLKAAFLDGENGVASRERISIQLDLKF